MKLGRGPHVRTWCTCFGYECLYWTMEDDDSDMQRISMAIEAKDIKGLLILVDREG